MHSKEYAILKNRTVHTGFAIAIAWPATFCKQPGSWYDPLMLLLGISKNHYYRVGHAALILVDQENRKCHYYDFGRYHAPFQYGRVRSSETDHELQMKTIPLISENGQVIENFSEILGELQMNKASHGEGELHASYSRIHFQQAFMKAEEMQYSGAIPYGPFRLNGSNCSRFVNTVVRTGKPGWKYEFRLKFLNVLTPTPMDNVNALNNKEVIPDRSESAPFFPFQKPGRKVLETTLPAPERNASIPEDAQWLSGEGAGSWFVINQGKSQLEITRYAPNGVVECKGLYENLTRTDMPDSSYRISHPSNCKLISLSNGDILMKFERVLPKKIAFEDRIWKGRNAIPW